MSSMVLFPILHTVFIWWTGHLAPWIRISSIVIFDASSNGAPLMVTRLCQYSQMRLSYHGFSKNWKPVLVIFLSTFFGSIIFLCQDMDFHLSCYRYVLAQTIMFYFMQILLHRVDLYSIVIPVLLSSVISLKKCSIIYSYEIIVWPVLIVKPKYYFSKYFNDARELVVTDCLVNTKEVNKVSTREQCFGFWQRIRFFRLIYVLSRGLCYQRLLDKGLLVHLY